MVDGDLSIDPWSSTQSTDYSRIIEQFGLSNLGNLTLPNPSHLHRRGIVFAHRDLELVLQAQKTGDKFGVLTGLMPSGRMHLGHSMVIEQVKWFQNLGGDVTIAVADLESQATRGVSLSKGREIALQEYVANYAALGLNPDLTNVYFQSTRADVQRLGFQLGKRTNLSEFESIYGFKGETNLAHVQAPMVQVGDILHPQTEDYGGLRPIVVPVGVDQDPHLRLTRGIASKSNWFNVKDNNGPGVLIGLSVQDDNAELFGQQPNGRIDKAKVASVFSQVVTHLVELGFSDINSNPKQGTIIVPSATRKDINNIRINFIKTIKGTKGKIIISDPWIPKNKSSIEIYTGKNYYRKFINSEYSTYANQIQKVSDFFLGRSKNNLNLFDINKSVICMNLINKWKEK